MVDYEIKRGAEVEWLLTSARKVQDKMEPAKRVG